MDGVFFGEFMNNSIVLIRHGESEWNDQGRFTGLSDVGLTELGKKQADQAGDKLLNDGTKFDIAFTSNLIRAQHTLDIILKKIDQTNIETINHANINERDFGDLTGQYHSDAHQKYGKTQIDQWRNSFEIAPPNGESLKDTYRRIVPYFQSVIFPHYLNGKNIIVVSHNVTLRALMMHLKNISPKDIVSLRLDNANPITYKLNHMGLVK